MRHQSIVVPGMAVLALGLGCAPVGGRVAGTVAAPNMPPVHSRASAPAAATPIVPLSVQNFTLVDTSRYENPALGTGYRYAGPPTVRANAYVYPVPGERLGLSDAERVSAEARVFVADLGKGVGAGFYDRYEVVIDTARTFTTPQGERPGQAVAFVFSQSGQAYVSLMHLICLGDHYVKVRLTIPGREWRENPAPDFALHLFAALEAR